MYDSNVLEIMVGILEEGKEKSKRFPNGLKRLLSKYKKQLKIVKRIENERDSFRQKL